MSRTFLTISIGISTRGAYLAFSDISLSNHLSIPSDRNSVFEPFSSILTLAARYSFLRLSSSSAASMNVLILLFFSSCSAIFFTRSLSVSISNVLASRIETVHSDGASRMRKSVPSDSLSSRSDRSDTIISTVLLFILKFSREFLSEKSSSFLSHNFCFVIGSLLPCATFPYSDISSSLGALILIRLVPSLSVFSAVSACSSLSGIGRMPLPLVRAISTAHIKPPGVFI